MLSQTSPFLYVTLFLLGFTWPYYKSFLLVPDYLEICDLWVVNTLVRLPAAHRGLRVFVHSARVFARMQPSSWRSELGERQDVARYASWCAERAGQSPLLEEQRH